MVARKKKAESKKKGMNEEEMEDELDEIEAENSGSGETGNPIAIEASKPIANVKKGDAMQIDGIEVEVDTHYCLMDHGSTKEMAIEVFDKNDKEYQIRYFNDQVESTLEVYELQEILYVKKAVKSVKW